MGIFVIYLGGASVFGGTVGAWLESFDVDAHEGRGAATFTTDAAHALRFADAGDAFAFYKQQSRVQPRRDDGKPNRPLTAYTVEIRPLGFTCPRCGRTSYNPNDARERYCGACHVFVDDASKIGGAQ